MRTGWVSRTACCGILRMNSSPWLAMSAARSARAAVAGSCRLVWPPLDALHHMQLHGSPRRCKLLTWLTTPHAEQRRKAYELPHGQSPRLSPGLEDLLIL